MSVLAFQSEKPGHAGNVFSNWYPAVFEMQTRTYSANGREFQIPGNTYTSTEQGMMEAKALCFGSQDTANLIMTDYAPGLPISTDDWAF